MHSAGPPDLFPSARPDPARTHTADWPDPPPLLAAMAYAPADILRDPHRPAPAIRSGATLRGDAWQQSRRPAFLPACVAFPAPPALTVRNQYAGCARLFRAHVFHAHNAVME